MSDIVPYRIAAIGDVHGEAKLLATALDGLRQVERELGVPIVVYFLGDIVDRGPDSRGALDLVDETLKSRSGSLLLLGNHDDWFLRFLTGDLDGDETANWIDQGGAETLRSYDLRGRTDAGTARRTILSERPDHLPMLQNARVLVTSGRFAFAHAGVDPERSFDRQNREDCIWIRGPFHRHVGLLEKVVVHGHQPQKGAMPVVTENRVSIDTGAVFSGRLSTVLLDPERGSMQFYGATAGGRFDRIEPIADDRGLGTALDIAPDTPERAGASG